MSALPEPGVRRKRPPYRPTIASPRARTGRFGDGWRPADQWPADGVVISQYSADGEIACYGALFRG